MEIEPGIGVAQGLGKIGNNYGLCVLLWLCVWGWKPFECGKGFNLFPLLKQQRERKRILLWFSFETHRSLRSLNRYVKNNWFADFPTIKAILPLNEKGAKKSGKVWSFNKLLVFFQWACRIIGPRKHVLHLVWSAYVISTARTALILKVV